MKKNILIIGLLIIYQSIFAQHFIISHINANHNPNNLNTENEGAYGTIIGWTLLLSGAKSEPIWSPTRTLPFDFEFNGKVFNKFRASSNGIVTFDTTEILPISNYERFVLPNDSVPDNSIGVLGLEGSGSKDYVLFKILGAKPNRQFWIQYNSYSFVHNPSTDSTYTFWSIVLEETTNKFYVVDQRTEGYEDSLKKVSIGVQYDKNKAIMLQGSPSIPVYSRGLRTPNDNTYYEFRQGSRPKYDVEMIALISDTFVSKGKYEVKTIITNRGTEVINNFDLNYKLSNGQIITTKISGLNVLTNEEIEVAHPVQLDLLQSGAFILEVWTSNLNGNLDEYPIDDKVVKKLVVFSQSVQKKPLFEMFSSSTCDICKPINIDFHSVLDSKNPNDFVYVRFPISSPNEGDPYTTWETSNRRFYYNNFIELPFLSIIGKWESLNIPFTEKLYQKSINHSAGFDLNGAYSFDSNAKTITAKINSTALFDASNYTLQMAIIEKQTTKNAKTNGETIFRNVVKKMLPNETGSLLKSYKDGDRDSITFSFQFLGDYRLPNGYALANAIDFTKEHSVEDFANLEVVAWIQGVGTEIQQAINLAKINTKILELLNVKELKIFPNPAVNQLNVSFEMEKQDKLYFDLYNLDGQLIKSIQKSVNSGLNTIEINTTDVISGVYYLSIIDSNNNVHVEPITIVR